MDENESQATTSDREASPTGELGRHTHKGVASIMWNGVWEPIGDVEFLTQNGGIVKVISFTPREFPSGQQPL
jgi:hypothetical protein